MRISGQWGYVARDRALVYGDTYPGAIARCDGAGPNPGKERAGFMRPALLNGSLPLSDRGHVRALHQVSELVEPVVRPTERDVHEVGNCPARGDHHAQHLHE